MVKKLKRKGDASAAPRPKAAAPKSAKPETFKKRRLVKADPEKLKAAAVNSAAAAEASASASAPKTVETSAPATAATPSDVGRERNRGDSSEKDKMKGKEEDRRQGEHSKTSGKGKEEQRRNRVENNRTKGKEKGGDKNGAGFIFMCSATTKPECYRNGVFGLPRGKMDVVEKIRPGAKLFLYDFDLKLMYGVYKATTKGGLDLVRHAFDGKFPAQVKFSVDLDCLPVPESSFKHAIKENYNSKGRFTQELSSRQIQRLLTLFKPIGLSQPPPQHIEDMQRPHIIEDRRESYVYDERRPTHHVDARAGPIYVHAPLVEDQYKIAPSLHPPLPSEPRHSLVLDHRPMPISLELRQAPVALASHHVPLNRGLQQAPPMYYHQVAPDSSYHPPHLDMVLERTAAEATVRDPVVSRDYGTLSGDLAARTERLDELYRSYKLSTRAMDIHQGPSYTTTSYGNTGSIYRENVQRPLSARIGGPSAPVSTRYSFAGPPSY